MRTRQYGQFVSVDTPQLTTDVGVPTSGVARASRFSRSLPTGLRHAVVDISLTLGAYEVRHEASAAYGEDTVRAAHADA